MVTSVFCDDAGFTGDNLLNPDQPYFAYSAIAVEPDHAATIVQDLRSRFPIRGEELKGSLLYGRQFAPELFQWLSEELGDRATVALNDKLYSLSAKFFEYVFEPLIAKNSRFFYELGFNRHIATVIWAHLKGQHPVADEIVRRFEALMRRRSGAPQPYFEPSAGGGEPDAIQAIIRFAHACRSEVEAEMASLADATGRIKWVLDLSFGSARSVLSTLGQRFGALQVMFDDSKPLAEYSKFFDNFIGRAETAFITMRGRTAPLTFNLAAPVRFGSSKTEDGLQIADLFASFTALAARDGRTTRGQTIMKIGEPHLNEESVVPDWDQLDLSKKEPFLNSALLLELVDRAEQGDNLLWGITDFYRFMSLSYDSEPPVFEE